MIDFAVKMQHLSLTMLRDDAPTASIELAKLQAVHLIESRAEESPLDDMPAMEYQELYQSLNSRYLKIAHWFNGPVSSETISSEAVSIKELEAINHEVKNIWSRISRFEEQIRLARDNINMTRQLESSLERFSSLDIDLGILTHDNQFIKTFIGTIPNGEYDQLERALSLADTVIDVFHQAEAHHYVTVVTACDHVNDVTEILKSAGFHEISIPGIAEVIDRQAPHQLERAVLRVDARPGGA